MKSPDPQTLTFDSNGLIVAIAQDSATGTVLMVAYMDRDALTRTVQTGEAHFWSRSRQALWHKGETSGNVLRVEAIQADCDGDALLLSVRPTGPACHTGQRSCFAAPATLLDRLEATLHDRHANLPSGSYSATLFDQGRPAIMRKVGEEATEVIVAADHESADALVHEVADLWFHSMLLLEERGISPSSVLQELKSRERR
ncbi:MAG TPA: bifunctional phosphoribosyl-AMP cyclohydrolase/phosphoribosyl-ATP diphosphatase HisIE [Candidatus Acidoferrum sp.]|nr:bifunctional phosphoribosyl-AMP cyclohydrolase/phosphoribosyl-ATP diphosphatase HisIE [Candidatus Acidoferrum sp.]